METSTKYQSFDIKTLQKLYSAAAEDYERYKQIARKKVNEITEYLADLLDRKQALEIALKKKGVLPNQIDIEEITEKPLTNEEKLIYNQIAVQLKT